MNGNIKLQKIGINTIYNSFKVLNFHYTHQLVNLNTEYKYNYVFSGVWILFSSSAQLYLVLIPHPTVLWPLLVNLNRLITYFNINNYDFRGVDSVQFFDTAVPVPDPPANRIVIVINRVITCIAINIY